MLFFDNERPNCAEVQRLGVTCVHCEDGMTREAWDRGLQEHAARRTAPDA